MSEEYDITKTFVLKTTHLPTMHGSGTEKCLPSQNTPHDLHTGYLHMDVTSVRSCHQCSWEGMYMCNW
jgi:hypothetical protein